MTLLNLSLGLAGIACVAIPIIIHLLFRRKRKPILWGAMRFLLEAYRRQRRRLTLEQILLLAARCLVVLLLALAIGRPVLERAGALGAGAARTVYLLIDNGLASSVVDESGESALERHKRVASATLTALGPSDRAGLIALGEPAEATVVPASTDIAAVGRLVSELRPTDAATDLSGALERLRVELSAAGARDESGRGGGGGATGDVVVVVLSEFLTGSADVGAPLPRALEGFPNVRILAARASQDAPGNVQIIDVAPLRPVVLTGEGVEGDSGATSEQVRVTLRRTGPSVAEAGATTVRLRAALASGEQTAESAPGTSQAIVRWQAGASEATTSLGVDLSGLGAAGVEGAEGEGAALIAEIDRDAVASDNMFRRPLSLREGLRVGVIARRRFGGAARVDRLDPADWARLALRPSESSPVEVVDIEPAAVDTASLAGLSVAVVARPDLIDAGAWTRLRQFVDAGGLLMVFPPTEPTVHLWTDSFTSAMGLSWRLAREARTLETPLSVSAEPGPGGRSPLLAMIEAELRTLAPPVNVSKLLPLEESPARLETLLTLSDGTAWIVASSPQRATAEEKPEDDARRAGAASGGERGLVVYFASAPALPAWTDLPAKPLMIPLMQEIVRQGVGRAQGSWTSIAGAGVAAPARAVELREVGPTQSGGRTLALDEFGRVATPVREAGLFRAIDARGATRGLVAVNADADAGRTDVQTATVVHSWLGASAQSPMAVAWLGAEGETAEQAAGRMLASLAEQRKGSPISLPLLIAALVIALLETVMARYFSHAFREQALPGGLETGGAGGAA